MPLYLKIHARFVRYRGHKLASNGLPTLFVYSSNDNNDWYECNVTSSWHDTYMQRMTGSQFHLPNGTRLSSPYCKDMWRRYCCLTIFFPIVDTCLSCEDKARQTCAMVPKCRIFGDFLGPAFPASRMQQIAHLHSKFALRPHHVWKYGRHPICDRWD